MSEPATDAPVVTNHLATDVHKWMSEFLTAYGITCEFGPPQRYDQFGNEYVELLLGGPVPYEMNNSECLITFARSFEQAQSHYERVLLSFLGDNRHIVWRVEPEIDEEKRKQKLAPSLFVVYSRLTAYPKRAA